jgi:MFS family permease
METKVPNEVSYEYPKYRWLIAFMFIFVTMLDLFLMSVVAPIMLSLQEAFKTDLTTIGYASTIVTAMLGAFMFIASIIIGNFNVKKSYIVATSLMLLGNIVCYFATSVGIFILGRALVGAGYGISGSLVSATTFMWFPSKERPMIFTANTMGAALIRLIAYNVIVPIYNFTGKWQTLFLLCIVWSAISLLSWTFFGKDFDIKIGGSPKRIKSDVKINPFDGLTQALKSKQLWLIAIPTTLTALASHVIGYYYPTFLRTIIGLSDVAASSVTSVLFAAGTIGTFLSGIFTTALGKRKLPIVLSTALTTISFVGLFLLKEVSLLIVAMVFYGIVNGLKNTAVQAASTEVEGMTPAMGAGANSMLYGFGSFMTLFLSPIIGMFVDLFGFSVAMIVLCAGLAFISFIVSAFIKDSGPKVKTN